MKKIIYLLLISCTTLLVQAQPSFDIFSYKAPAGFILKEKKGYLCYQKNDGKNYCQLFLYPATAGEKDIEKDFETNWNFFARNPQQKINNPETKEKDTLNGWQTITGAARGNYNKQMFALTLSTFSKDSFTYFVATVFTDKKYIPIAQEFITAVVPNEKKLVRNTNITQPAQHTFTPTFSTIAKTTTKFTDGWSATATSDYVKVTKAGTEVRLYFVNAAIDQQRPSKTNTFEPYYWKTVVEKSFNTSQPFIREKEAYSYGTADIWEAAVTDKQTGQSGYLGMRLLFTNGACQPIVVIARDKNTYYSLFSKDEDFTRLPGYNKFAVSQNDLVGKWKSFDAASISYYSVYTGDYAGMSTASTNDDFTFNNNGTYESVHAGTSSFRGTVAHGKTSYKGTFSASNWNLTASNRGANDPGEFTCQFEAIKGGYMLRLQNKTFSGEVMTLFKSK
jgi:hypothetical protein